jgi:hypothetical protein
MERTYVRFCFAGAKRGRGGEMGKRVSKIVSRPPGMARRERGEWGWGEGGGGRRRGVRAEKGQQLTPPTAKRNSEKERPSQCVSTFLNS